MTERTALLLASLSHDRFWMVCLLPIIFGVAAAVAGKMQMRAGAEVNARAFAVSRMARRVSRGLFAASVIVFGVALCHFGCAALVAHSSECRANGKLLAMGMAMYAADYDEHLPAAAHWEEAIAPRVKKADRSEIGNASSDPFHCPAAFSTASYGMNAILGSRSESDLEAPAETVMLFDANAPRHSFSGGAKDLARERHSSAPNIVFADGHVKSENTYGAAQLNWTLKATEDQRQTTTPLPGKAE